MRTTLICGYPGETERDFWRDVPRGFWHSFRLFRLFYLLSWRENPRLRSVDDVPWRSKTRAVDAIMELQQGISTKLIKKK